MKLRFQMQLICFAVVAVMFPVTGFCKDTIKLDVRTESPVVEKEKNLDFVVDEKGILQDYKGTSNHVIIPDNVKKISFGIFMERPEIEFVTFPEGLLCIDEYAFYGCTGLKEINLPESVTEIRRLSFGECPNLETIYFGENLQDIGELAVWGCNSLEYIRVSEENELFSDIDGILYNKDVTTLILAPIGIQGTIQIPDSVESISAYAFCECDKIEKVVFGEKLKNVGEAAFLGCAALRKVATNDNLEQIGSAAFSRCVSLKEIILWEKVNSIGDMAFSHCFDLEKAVILSENAYFGHRAFYYCKNIKIAGYANSTAQEYALERHRVFEVLSSERI